MKRKRDLDASDVVQLINDTKEFRRKKEHDIMRILANDKWYNNAGFSCLQLSDKEVEYIIFILGLNTHVRRLNLACKHVKTH